MVRKKEKVNKESYVLQIGDRGRIILPSELRKRLGLKEGDRILLTVEEDGSARLVSVRSQVENAKGMLKHVSPQSKVVDEFISERRAEVKCE